MTEQNQIKTINFAEFVKNELLESDNYKDYDYDDYSISSEVEYTTQEWLCSIKNKEYTSVFFIQTIVCISLYHLIILGGIFLYQQVYLVDISLYYQFDSICYTNYQNVW